MSQTNNNDGGRDMRTAAELALAPDEPLSREPAPPQKKLTFADKAKNVLGSIKSATSLGGAAFNSFKKTFALKDQLAKQSAAVSTALTQFDASSRDVLRGIVPQQDNVIAKLQQPAAANVDAFVSATDLTQISGMAPGFVTSAAQLAATAAVLTERKRQLQKIQQSLEKKKNQVTGGTGARIQENTQRSTHPTPAEIGAPSIAPLAEGDDGATREPALADKQKATVTGNTIASGKPSFWSRFKKLADFRKAPGYNATLNVVFADKKNQAGWSEPAAPYAAQYPHNNVTKTASGHIIEYDDTPGAERIHIFHRSGSFIEMHADGTVVYKSFADGYSITHGNQYVKVNGSCHVSVDGDVTLYAKNNVDVKSDNTVSIHTMKDFEVYAEGDIKLRSKKTTYLDGNIIDLRYMKLGEGAPVAPVPGGVAPLIDLKALAQDFPLYARAITMAQTAYKANIAKQAAVITTKMGTQLAAAAALATPAQPTLGTNAMAAKILSATKDTLALTSLIGFGPADLFAKILKQNGLRDTAQTPPIPTDQIPRTSPLGNPLIYHATSQAAVNYRALQLDTPEEMQSTELYQAHLDTRKALKDVANTYVNIIGGSTSQPATGIVAPAVLPTINFLNRDAFRGVYTFSSSATLGVSSFTVADLVDSLSKSDVANPDVTSTVEPSETGLTLNGLPNESSTTEAPDSTPSASDSAPSGAPETRPNPTPNDTATI